MITGFDIERPSEYSRAMNIKDWADKFAVGIQEWIASVEDMFDVELEDEEDK